MNTSALKHLQNQGNNIETKPNFEQQKIFDENIDNFNKSYRGKLENIGLGKDLIGKVAGNFESKGDINSSLKILGYYNLSEKTINSIKQYLENVDVDIKKLQETIQKELEYDDKKNNLNLQIKNLLPKAVKIVEESKNDELFKKLAEIREIQINGTLEEKQKSIYDLQNITNGQFQLGNKLEDTGVENNPNDIVPDDLIAQKLNPNEEEVTNQILDNNEKKEVESDSPYFPILKNLKAKGYVDNKKFKEVIKVFNSKDKEQEKGDFLKLVNSIPNKNLKESILKSFDKKEKIDKNNFKNTPFAKDSKELNISLDKGVGGLEIMLANDYVSIPNKENKINKQENLLIGMETTINNIITNNSSDFKKQNGELISEIKVETNLERKYSLLKKLYKNDLLDDAKKGGKKAKEEINGNKEKLIEEYKKVMKEIEIAEKINDPERKSIELTRLSKIVNQGKEIDNFEKEIKEIKKLNDKNTGDVFEGGEEDKTPTLKDSEINSEGQK